MGFGPSKNSHLHNVSGALFDFTFQQYQGGNDIRTIGLYDEGDLTLSDTICQSLTVDQEVE